MNKRTKAKRKTRLNDNEVREVAKMQMVIDHYEDSLFRLSMFAEGRGDGNILAYDEEGDFWLRKLYKFVEEHREEKQ